MKWLLIVLIMNQPVKTDLTFESLNTCMEAEEKMRKEWANRFNEVVSRPAFQKLSAEDKKASRTFMLSQATSGTCIPTK